jgi:4'-phosphopantetheinyl transferase
MRQINVTNKFLADVTWLDESLCSFEVNEGIHVWKIGFESSPAPAYNFNSILTRDEIERSNRFYQQKDRDRFAISRFALRTILGKYLNQPASMVQFENGINKKPFIRNGNFNNLQYNLSHSGNAIVLAVAGSAVGADIEFINDSFSYIDVLQDNFSDAEVKYIAEADSTYRFFKLWTRKEAITKATAQGLDCDLRLLPGLDGKTEVEPGVIASDEDWLINSFNLNSRYIASIAGHPLIDDISFFDYRLDDIIDIL